MRSLDVRGDTPSLEPGDALEVEVIPHSFQFRHCADDPELVEAIVDAVNAMGGAGDCAEDDYQEALSALRRRTKKASAAIVGEYQALPEDDYLGRWSLVMLLTELGHRDSVRLFAEILESRIPEERSPNPHSFTTVGEEVMIRTTVVEGLERLAAEGNDDAVEVLLANVNHDNFSIRRASVQALIATGGDDMRERLIEVLPSRHHDLLRIERRDVRTVEQAQGGLFLKPTEQDRTPRPADDCDEPANGHGKDGDVGNC